VSLRHAAVGACLALLSTSTLAVADPTPRPTTVVTLLQVLKLLRERSPTVAALRGPTEVARAEVVAAGAHPNPTLSYGLLIGIEDPSFINGTQHTPTLEQPVLVGGQRGARKTAARLGVEAAEARERSAYHDIAREARSLFVELLADQEREQNLETSLADFSRARCVVLGRADSGAMSQYDEARIDVEVRAAAARLAQARGDTEDTSGRLASLLGEPVLRPRASGDLRGFVGVAQAEPVAVDRLPSVVAANRSIEAARAAVDVAKRDRVPTPTFGVGASFTTNSYTLAANLGVSIDLPIFDRNQGAIARAGAELDAVELERQATRVHAAAEVVRASDTLRAREQALAQYEDSVVAHLPELRRMANDAYQTGRGTILELLDTLRTADEAGGTEIDYLEAAALASVDLLAAQGRAGETAGGAR